ncbi:MAG: methionyl-tRNA formyltransferase [Proteobacteria bacterium]|nr:methionyl-tRNA formyltransferase [Pseudomonadota bacterium]MBU1736798.1 methionyl-tRNA formyltransferase [Pseudomonadota bacterium]
MAHEPYRIIFMGTPEFAVPSLQSLLSGPDEVVAVVTQPDRPKGRGRKVAAPPVKELALAKGLPVLQPTAIKTAAWREELAAYRPDLFIVAAYGRILPKSLLELPPHGTINVHGSILPSYRGAAPIQWAILNGDTFTGVTIMQMDEGMDTGDILLTAETRITPEDTAGSLAGRLAEIGGATLLEALAKLHEGRLVRQVQAHHLATSSPPLTKEQGLIDWRRPAFALSCQIRGLDPWPTAYTFIEGTRLRLFKPSVVDRAATEKPGTICRADKDGLLIATGEKYLLTEELQAEGAKRMTTGAYLQGRSIKPGTVLG